MGTSKNVVQVGIEFQVIDNMKRGISKIQSNLNKLNLDKLTKNNFNNLFDNFGKNISDLENRAIKGISSKKDAEELTNSYNNVLNIIKQIEKAYSSISKNPIQLISDKDKTNLEKITKGIQEYYKEVEAASKDRKSLEKDLAKKQKNYTEKKAVYDNEKNKKVVTESAYEVAKREKSSTLSALTKGKTKKANGEITEKDYKKLEQAAESTRKAFEGITTKSKLAEAKAQVDAISQEIDGLKQKIKECNNVDFNAFEKIKQSLQKNGVTEIDWNKVTNIDELQQTLNNLSTDALDKVETALNNTDTELNKISNDAHGMDPLIKGAVNTGKEMDRAQKSVDSFTSRLEQFFSMANGFRLIERVMRSAFNTVKELDAAMTETAVVTDMSVSDMWKQLDTYTEKANELGATTKGAYETMTLYYQQGLNDTEAWELGTETIKMARIAGMDYAKTTDAMTAALRGFNLELTEASAMRVNDLYSELAAKTASNTKEISTAMEKTASLAHNAGMDLETTAVYLAQAIETTREAPENIGTAMKTILARFQSLTKDPSELTVDAQEALGGESVDANVTEAALRKAGVALRDTNGEFRAAKDVLLDLNKVWDTLDKNTQRYIATQTAGSRQQSRFIAMMQDYGRTQQLMGYAENSAGASEEQFEKTQESLESKLNKLKNAWNEFTMGIFNSDLIKLGVDALTKLLNIINKLTGSMGPFVSMLTKSGLAFGLFKAGQKGLGVLSSILGANSAGGIGELAGILERLSKFKMADIFGKLFSSNWSGLLEGFTKKFNTILNSLKASLANIGNNIWNYFGQNISKSLTPTAQFNAQLLKMSSAGAVATAAILAIALPIIQEKKACERATEAIEEYNEASSKIQESRETIGSLKDEFYELADGVNEAGQNVGLSSEQFDKYHEIVGQLVDISPNIVKAYDNEGNAIIDKANALKILNEELEYEDELAKRKYTTNQNINDIITNTNKSNRDVLSNENIVNGGIGWGKNGTTYGLAADSVNVSNTKDLLHVADTYNEEKNALQQKIKELQNTITEGEILLENGESASSDKRVSDYDLKSQKAQLAAYEEELANLENLKVASDEAKANYQDLIDSLTTYATTLDGTAYLQANFNDLFSAGIKEIAYTTDDAASAKESVNKFISVLKKTPKVLKSYKKAQRVATEAKKQFDKSAKNTKDIKAYNKAVNESYQDMIKKAEEFENSQDETLQAAGAAMRQYAEEMKNYATESKDSLTEALNPFQDQIAAAEQLGSAIDEIKEHDYYTAATGMAEMLEEATNDINAAGKGSKTYWTAASAVLSEEAMAAVEYDKAAIDKMLAKAKSYGAEGKAGAINFAKELSKKGLLDDSGKLNFDTSNMDDIASEFGLTTDAFIAALNKSAQFIDIDWANSFDAVLAAARRTEEVFTSTNQYDNTGKDGKSMIWEDELKKQANQAGADFETIKKEWLASGNVIMNYSEQTGKELAESFKNLDNRFFNEDKNAFNQDTLIAALVGQNMTEDEILTIVDKMASEGFEFDGKKTIGESIDDAVIAKAIADDPTTNILKNDVVSRLDTMIAIMGGFDASNKDLNKEDTKDILDTVKKASKNGKIKKNSDIDKQITGQISKLETQNAELQTAIDNGTVGFKKQKQYQAVIDSNNAQISQLQNSRVKNVKGVKKEQEKDNKKEVKSERSVDSLVETVFGVGSIAALVKGVGNIGKASTVANTATNTAKTAMDANEAWKIIKDLVSSGLSNDEIERAGKSDKTIADALKVLKEQANKNIVKEAAETGAEVAAETGAKVAAKEAATTGAEIAAKTATPLISDAAMATAGTAGVVALPLLTAAEIGRSLAAKSKLKKGEETEFTKNFMSQIANQNDEKQKIIISKDLDKNYKSYGLEKGATYEDFEKKYKTKNNNSQTTQTTQQTQQKSNQDTTKKTKNNDNVKKTISVDFDVPENLQGKADELQKAFDTINKIEDVEKTVKINVEGGENLVKKANALTQIDQLSNQDMDVSASITLKSNPKDNDELRQRALSLKVAWDYIKDIKPIGEINDTFKLEIEKPDENLEKKAEKLGTAWDYVKNIKQKEINSSISLKLSNKNKEEDSGQDLVTTATDLGTAWDYVKNIKQREINSSVSLTIKTGNKNPGWLKKQGEAAGEAWNNVKDITDGEVNKKVSLTIVNGNKGETEAWDTATKIKAAWDVVKEIPKGDIIKTVQLTIEKPADDLETTAELIGDAWSKLGDFTSAKGNIKRTAELTISSDPDKPKALANRFKSAWDIIEGLEDNLSRTATITVKKGEGSASLKSLNSLVGLNDIKDNDLNKTATINLETKPKDPEEKVKTFKNAFQDIQDLDDNINKVANVEITGTKADTMIAKADAATMAFAAIQALPEEGLNKTAELHIKGINADAITAKATALTSLMDVWNKIKSETKTLTIKVVKKGANSIRIVGEGVDKTITISPTSAATGKNIMGSLAGGTGAKRAKLGPNNNGGMTLTGELGPELVWEPSKGISYITGENGPEMRNLSGDAVVWPADQTKKIMSTAAEGKNTFGSMGWADFSKLLGGGSGYSRTTKTRKGYEKWYDYLFKRWFNDEKRYDKYIRMATSNQTRYEKSLKKSNNAAESLKYFNRILKSYQRAGEQAQKALNKINARAKTLSKSKLTDSDGYYLDKNGKKVKKKSQAVDVSKYFNVKKDSEGNYIYELTSAGRKKKDNGGALAKAIKDWESKFSEIQSDSEKYLDAIAEAEEAQADLLESTRSSSADFLNNVVEMLTEQTQNEIDAKEKQIDKLNDINSSIDDSNQRLLDAINKSVEHQRQLRDNDKTEQDINDKRAQLALLKQDTSGANATRIKELEKEIADSEEDYTDTLVDQKISDLEEQLDEAAQQRELQIKLLEEQKALQEKLVDDDGMMLKAYEWIITNKGEDGNFTDKAMKQIVAYAWKSSGYNVLEAQEVIGEFNSGIYNLNALLDQDTEEDNIFTLLNDILSDPLGSETSKDINDIARDTAEIAKGLVSESKNVYKGDSFKTGGKTFNKGDVVDSKDTWKNGGWTYSAAVNRDKPEQLDITRTKTANGLTTTEKFNPKTNDYELYETKEVITTKNKNGSTTTTTTINNATQDWESQEISSKQGLPKGTTIYVGKKKYTLSSKHDLKDDNTAPGFKDGDRFFTGIEYDSKNKKWIAEKTHKYAAPSTFMSGITDWSDLKTWQKWSLAWALNKLKYNGSNVGNWTFFENPGTIFEKIKGEQTFTNFWTKFNKSYGRIGSGYTSTTKSILSGKGYKTGGIADYTGPAWLDGTPTKPELVLNAQDTANFIELKNILGSIMSGNSSLGSASYGDTVINLDIKVDQMASDYDAEKLAKQIEKKITQSSNYRNVSTVKRMK